MITLEIYLAQHAQGHVDGGQQGSKRRSHIRVKRRSCEAEHKQGSILCQVHTLTHKQRHRHYIIRYFKFPFTFLCSYLSINISGSGSFSCLSRLTWSRSIWQQSGVKCCSVARVLLRIFRRLHCTASRAFCSASSLSPPPGASLDGVWGGRCVLGRGPGGNASPFLA